jgi:hypothetical protein
MVTCFSFPYPAHFSPFALEENASGRLLEATMRYNSLKQIEKVKNYRQDTRSTGLGPSTQSEK